MGSEKIRAGKTPKSEGWSSFSSIFCMNIEINCGIPMHSLCWANPKWQVTMTVYRSIGVSMDYPRCDGDPVGHVGLPSVKLGNVAPCFPTRFGWWFGTWLLFFQYIYTHNYIYICILGIIIPTDFHIFQRGWNHPPEMVFFVSREFDPIDVGKHMNIWLFSISLEKLKL